MEAPSETRGTNGPRWSGPLPPGYTVDELRWHRKKRPPAGAAPSDNLTPSDGSMRAFRTEYSRRFRPFRCGPPSSDDEAASAPEDAPSDDELPLARRRRPRGRRDPQVGQTLGSVDSLLPISTEHREKYIPMALSERGTAGKPTLIRRPTSLSQLTHPNEGEVARSETAERFARDILTVAASGPCKRRTQLRLDGPLLTSSETKSSFVPQDGGARPPLAKRATTLRLEGDLILLPEYRRSYVSPTPKPDLPPIEPPPKPVEPPPKPKTPPKPIEPPAMEVKKVEEDVKVVGRRKDLIPIDRDPEYRSSFVDFTRERTQAATPSRPPSRQRKYSTATLDGGRRKRSEPHEEACGRFECQPEYRRAYINYLTRENRDRIHRPYGPAETPVRIEPKPAKEKPKKQERERERVRVRERDRSVPRTPTQEKVLVPDLSGNAVRRMSSIFGPKTTERVYSPCPVHKGRPRRHSPCARMCTDSSSDDCRQDVRRTDMSPSFVVLNTEINNNVPEKCRPRGVPPWYEPPVI